MSRYKKSKFVSSISIIILLLGCIGVVLYLSGVRKDDLTDIINPVFRVEYDDNIYKADTDNIISLPSKGQARFEVKGTDGYSVKVVPNVVEECDFNYTVNGKSYSYFAEKDLSSAFELQSYASAFVLDMSEKYDIESVLSRLWGSDNITVGEHESFILYKFVVTSVDGQVIELPFGSSAIKIVLPESIVF